MPMWVYIAAGVAVIAQLCPQSRDRVKDIPWLPIAVLVGVRVLSDSISDSVHQVGTQITAEFERNFDVEETFEVEVLQNSAVQTPHVLGHIGNQEVQGNFRGFRVVKRRRLLTD